MDQFQGVRKWMNSASINVNAAGRESIPWGKSWYLDLLENKIFSTRLPAVEQLLKNICWTNYIRSSEACTSFLQIQNLMQSRSHACQELQLPSWSRPIVPIASRKKHRTWIYLELEELLPWSRPAIHNLLQGKTWNLDLSRAANDAK